MFLTENQFRDALHWYQKKIGSYDQPFWEKSIEERVLRGLSHAIPKKVARVKKESIDLDLDLIRGSYFAKAKPQQSWLTTTYLGIVRILLLPFYINWWSEQTNSWICAILFALYCLQMISMYIYFNSDKDDFDQIPISEVVSPLFMFFILGTMQSQIGASSSNKTRSYRSRLNCQSSSKTNTGNLVGGGLMGRSVNVQSNPSSNTSSNNYVNNCKNCQRKQDSLRKKNRDTSLSSQRHHHHHQHHQLHPHLQQQTHQKDQTQRQQNQAEHDDHLNLKQQSPSFKLKASDDESGLDSMDIQENQTSGRKEPRIRKRKVLNNNDDTQEEADNSDNSSTPGSCSPSGTSPSTSASGSSTKSNPGYNRRKNLQHRHQEALNDDNAELNPFSVEKDVNSDTEPEPEPDGTIGDLSSADECSPYSTIDSNNQFEWRRKYKIPRTNGIKIETSSRHRKDRSPGEYRKDLANEKSKKRSKAKSPRLQFRLPCKNPRDCTSSGDSECSLSPTSPITKLASDLDWPSINSDATSDDDVEPDDVADVDPLRKLDNDDYFTFCDDTRIIDDLNPSVCHVEDGSYSQRSGKALNDKVSCAIWQMRECQKVDLSVLDISSAIIRKVESVKHSNEYFYLGFILSLVLAFIPVIFRVRQFATSPQFSATRKKVIKTPFFVNSTKEIADIIQEIPTLATDLLVETMVHSFSCWNIQFVVLVAILERFFLSLCFFFLLCVAERTFRERFLYAKYFCHLTSSRRARRSDLPHFRLNKVRNIKTWLSVRSYLHNHGPQRSIDAIVSSSFIVEVSILTFLCIQLLRDNEICSEKLYCWEMVFWNLAIGLYIMRLIILGSKMNRKSRGCLTILLSEQINLYLQLEQKPHKKEDLTLANQLIKSAADVLKLLEAPFKISGFSANPYLYNITKVIVLSAFSAVLTELLGFKLKLYKIKLTT